MVTLTSTVPPAPTFSRVVHLGFTLTEMAVVLVIVALLIGGMIMPMSAQQDIRNTSDTQKLLADVGEALYGFAASHAASDGKPYLPCPDTDNDGAENRTGNACTNQAGMLPWADLGLGRQDAWGNTPRYAVTDVFSNSATGFTLLSAGNLRVCGETACTTALASTIPAVVLAQGKNGAATPTDADELENTDGDTDFVQRTATASFDDITIWLPSGILINRMVSAGKLP
jgi:prepilin-type N-terminal cleavage/methylation domain-containing protein